MQVSLKPRRRDGTGVHFIEVRTNERTGDGSYETIVQYSTTTLAIKKRKGKMNPTGTSFQMTDAHVTVS
jgi:hypothetical protein